MRRVLSAAALVAGLVGLGLLLTDFHGHRCRSCGRKWWHAGAAAMGSKEKHHCPGCGAGPEWDRA